MGTSRPPLDGLRREAGPLGKPGRRGRKRFRRLSCGYRSANRPSNPHVLWVPSQKGLLDDSPQRQRKKGFPSRVSILLPSKSTRATSPSTLYEPASEIVIFTSDKFSSSSWVRRVRSSRVIRTGNTPDRGDRSGRRTLGVPASSSLEGGNGFGKFGTVC